MWMAVGAHVAWLAGASLAGAQPAPEDFAEERVVHRFDFYEPGNNEDLPMFWEPFRPSGFPRFATGGFDMLVGRLAAPSFRLRSDGRSVAYAYAGPDTPVRVNSEYRIEAYILPDHMQTARAFISAHFLDAHRRPLPGTLVRSRFVGGPDEVPGWVKVGVFLPSAPPDARTIGVIVWVLQSSVWRTAARPVRYIEHNDIHAGAAFDDMSVYALPRAAITTAAPGHVLADGDTMDLLVTLADDGETALQGLVMITAADGSIVSAQPVPVVVGGAFDPTRIDVTHLQPGLYTARLDVRSDEHVVLRRSVTFVRAAPVYGPSGSAARAFGVVLDPRARSDPETELALLGHLAIGSTKLPIWTGLADPPQTPAQRRAVDRFRYELVKRGFALTAVFAGPPAYVLRDERAYPRPLLEIVAEESAGWQEHLAAVVAPSASAFRWWQLGADGDAAVVNDPRLNRALGRLRTAMRPFMTAPELAVPGSSSMEPPAERLDAEQLVLTLGPELPPDAFADRVAAQRALGYRSVTAFVKPLPRGVYDRVARLGDWARRLIVARHAGADVVFGPQPWRVRAGVHGDVTEPTEDYLVLRTVADVVADARPAGRIDTDSTAECLVFHNGDTAVLAVWDPHAPTDGTRLTLQLGAAARQIDMWGRARPLERDDHGRQIIVASPLPVFVDGVDRWLVDFRMGLRLTPDELDFGTDTVDRTLSLTHAGPRPVSGSIALGIPDDWEVTPQAFPFSLMARQTLQRRLALRYPRREPAGRKIITARFDLSSAGRRYYLEVPLGLELRLADVDVAGVPVIDGDDLVLRHIVTNRSSTELSFRGSASVPGRARQYRPMTGLRPGDTQITEYRFGGGARLRGRTVQLMLQEMADGPRRHNLELIVP